MIPLPSAPIEAYFEDLGILRRESLPKELEQKKRLFSEGRVHLYRGEAFDKLVTLRVKGLNMYHYDFGMAYPSAQSSAPLFLYQVIIAPKRALALVHYPHWDLKALEEGGWLSPLLAKEEEYRELFIKDFKPQEFLLEDVIPNGFNGLVRTTEIDQAYGAIAELFQTWAQELQRAEEPMAEEAIQRAMAWRRAFTQRFYQRDYGFTSTKRYLGEKWSRRAFEEVLFKL